MKSVRGNLVTMSQGGMFDVVVHGCNCFNTMSKGLAESIMNEWPQVFVEDNNTRSGDRQKPGTYSYATCKSNYKTPLTIINAYTQYYYSPKRGINVDYNAIRSVFKLLKLRYSGKKFGIPRIGAGLAGGDWNIISKIIDEEMDGEDVTLVEFYGK
jgi:O-acetyl-ADP-ribose deacetylase (regulator of RNase III)